MHSREVTVLVTGMFLQAERDENDLQVHALTELESFMKRYTLNRFLNFRCQSERRTLNSVYSPKMKYRYNACTQSTNRCGKIA